MNQRTTLASEMIADNEDGHGQSKKRLRMFACLAFVGSGTLVLYILSITHYTCNEADALNSYI